MPRRQLQIAGPTKSSRIVREAVECAVVRQARSSFAPQSRERIEDRLAMQDMVAERGDHATFQRYDEMFPVEPTEGAGDGLAWESIRDVKAHMDRVCHLTLQGRGTTRPLIDPDRAIVAAIDAADAASAEAAMGRHLTESLRALPKAEAAHPDLLERQGMSGEGRVGFRVRTMRVRTTKGPQRASPIPRRSIWGGSRGGYTLSAGARSAMIACHAS